MKNVSTEENQLPAFKWRIWPSLIVMALSVLMVLGGWKLFTSYFTNVYGRGYVPNWGVFFLTLLGGPAIMVLSAWLFVKQLSVVVKRCIIGYKQKQRLQRDPRPLSPMAELRLHLRQSMTEEDDVIELI
jgi:hypothetical protein